MTDVPYAKPNHPVAERAETVLDLLIAQCGDLEALLALARREEEAAIQQDFDELLHIISARATLGDRLEVYHRQIAELRQQFDAANAWPASVTQKTTALIQEIQVTDARTRPLLLAARTELGAEHQRVQRGQRGVNAYLHAGNSAIACDQRV